MDNQNAKVLIVDDIAATRNDIRRLLSFEDDIKVIGEACDGEEAIELAARLHPDVVLMDVNLPGIDGISASELILNEVPDIGIVIVSIQGEQEYLKRAMSAGARDYLVKPFSSSELTETIRRVKAKNSLLKKRPATSSVSEKGRIISIFSSKGGTGKTVIASNLAVIIAQETKKNVALVDLNIFGGDIAILFNVLPLRTLAELIEETELTPSVITRYMVNHVTGLKLLAAPLNPEDGEKITLNQIKNVLSHLQSVYDYIVIDLNTSFSDINLHALSISDTIILLLSHDLLSVKHAKTDLDILKALGCTDKTLLVLNGENKDANLRPADIEKALGRNFCTRISKDSKVLLSSIEKGFPFVLARRRSAVSAEMFLLTQTILQQKEVQSLKDERIG